MVASTESKRIFEVCVRTSQKCLLKPCETGRVTVRPNHGRRSEPMRGRKALFTLCVVLLAALASGRAHAQATQDKPFDLKPFIPPVIPLPPKAQVTPGGVDLTPSYSDPSRVTHPQPQNNSSGGIRITIPR